MCVILVEFVQALTPLTDETFIRLRKNEIISLQRKHINND